jgi:RNA polymerase sigma-70 factor (ECF subfamily)
MAAPSTSTTGRELELLEAARGGDQEAYRRLVEPRHAELHAHCYRMLGSVHDADDALQETLLRAWRGLAQFEGRSSLRSWLYTIATNSCLNLIAKRPKRVLPIDYGPAADPHDGPGQPLVESVLVEPYPDEGLGLESGFAAPEARYELRESVELAFVAALQNLPANQRAVLILREVLGFSARDVAESLDTTVTSVNSALQRARKTVDERLPEQSQQATLRSLGDQHLREVVESYMDAMGRGDVDAVISMLSEDAAWSMPPLGSWYRGQDALRVFLTLGPLSGNFRWRHLPAHANGQAAIGCYTWHPEADSYLPFALDVLTLRGTQIEEVTAFIARSAEGQDREALARWPDQPADASKVEAIFERLGLPSRLD